MFSYSLMPTSPTGLIFKRKTYQNLKHLRFKLSSNHSPTWKLSQVILKLQFFQGVLRSAGYRISVTAFRGKKCESEGLPYQTPSLSDEKGRTRWQMGTRPGDQGQVKPAPHTLASYGLGKRNEKPSSWSAGWTAGETMPGDLGLRERSCSGPLGDPRPTPVHLRPRGRRAIPSAPWLSSGGATGPGRTPRAARSPIEMIHHTEQHQGVDHHLLHRQLRHRDTPRPPGSAPRDPQTPTARATTILRDPPGPAPPLPVGPPPRGSFFRSQSAARVALGLSLPPPPWGGEVPGKAGPASGDWLRVSQVMKANRTLETDKGWPPGVWPVLSPAAAFRLSALLAHLPLPPIWRLEKMLRKM